MKKISIKILKIVGVLYVLVCILLYFFQEQLIFFPQKLDNGFQFQFDQPFEEQSVKTADGKLLDGILFRSDSSKGLIFYLHGNAGSLNSWGKDARVYTDLHYDVFMLDYRGYGKSEGSIRGQAGLFEDIQAAYNEQKKNYQENNIIVLGYSIGTGPAARLASTNKPGLLILQAPYYSLTGMMRHNYPILPTFILRYKFETDKYLKDCTMPVVIFHGDQDEVIYYSSSLKLQKEFNIRDTLITLKGQAHNGMTDNPDYKTEIEKILTWKLR